MDIQFGAPETISVAELKGGDFVVTILPHLQYRATKVGSGIRTITDAAYGRYRVTNGRGRGGMDVQSRTLTFHAADGYTLPVDCQVVVRRVI